MNYHVLRSTASVRGAGRPSLRNSSKSSRAATAVTHASTPVQARFGGGGKSHCTLCAAVTAGA
jgi:hypothetical protein